MEEVLVVRRDTIPKEALVQGFSAGVNYVSDLMKAALFKNRAEVEIDPTYKQIIPQIVVRNESGDIFVVQRLKTQGESRLHGRHSIGIGGHINPIDQEVEEGSDLITEGFMRELHEELIVNMDKMISLEWLGTMNDDSNEVGTVHFAVVLMITFEDSAVVEVNEKDKMVGGFIPMVEASTHYDNMENWSKIIFNEINI